MSSIAILSANLNSFDKVVEPVEQKLPDGVEVAYHCFDDLNFPPITGLTPRLQYRLPKFFGWQMFRTYDIYIWLDGSISLVRKDSAEWLLGQLGDADIAVFQHPYRNTIEEESDHIEDHLKKSKPYITVRYKNGLHKEQLAYIQSDTSYIDDHLYASTAFIYRDSKAVRQAFKLCWLHSSRYFTCDQLAFTYALKNLKVNVIEENPFSCKYIKLVSYHK